MITEILSSIKAISGLQRPLKTNYHRTFIPVQKNLSHINDEIDLTEREKQLLSHPSSPPPQHTHKHTPIIPIVLACTCTQIEVTHFTSFITHFFLLSCSYTYCQQQPSFPRSSRSCTSITYQKRTAWRRIRSDHEERNAYITFSKRAQATHYWWQSQVIFPWFFRANQPS